MHSATTRLLVGLALAATSPAARADEITVMSSGGLTAAYQALVPGFERKTGHHVVTVLGPSMGNAPDAIPNRLAQGEPDDVVLMVGSALGDLIAKGEVVPDSRVDVANSKIAMAVKAGHPVPDISTMPAFKAALIAAGSIAYSDSASGVYIEREMYDKLGLKAQLGPKSRMIVSERVGNVVARGEAEIGFQQVAELRPVKGITVVGEIPETAQKVTLFSAGISAKARHPEAARALIAYLVSEEARPTLVETGLEPVLPGAK